MKWKEETELKQKTEKGIKTILWYGCINAYKRYNKKDFEKYSENTLHFRTKEGHK